MRRGTRLAVSQKTAVAVVYVAAIFLSTMDTAIVNVALSLLGLLGTGTSPWLVRIVLYFMGFAVGQVFVATQAASFATISPAASGRASTLFTVGRRLGGAIGVAVSTTAILLASAHVRAPGGGRIDPFAYRIAFLMSAALNLLGLWSAWTVRDRDAASTIPQSRRKRARTLPVVPRARPAPPNSAPRQP
jgi:MFS family permease